MTLITGALALILKEIQQHTAAFIGGAILYGALLIITVALTLATEGGSVIDAAANMTFWMSPLLSFYVVGRLVSLEYRHRTWEFLAALPSSALVRAIIKYGMGAILVGVLNLLSFAFIAILGSQQELLPLGFLVIAVIQVSVYAWAWYALVFVVAHVGRFRAVVWLLLMPLLASLSNILPTAFDTWMWHASLSRPFDETRADLPWEAIAVSVLWALAFSLLGLIVSSMGGGARVAAWFRRPLPRERAAMVVLVLVGLLALDVVDDEPLLGGPVYQSVPQVDGDTGVVRVIGAVDSPLWRRGQALETDLDALGEILQITWPDVVLIAAETEAGAPVSLRTGEFGEIALDVNPGGSDARARVAALHEVLDWRSGGLLRRRSDKSWVLLGAPRWLHGAAIEDDPQELRAAVAGRVLPAPEDLVDTLELEAQLGTDVASAVAWVGLQVIEEQAGKEAVEALLRAHLAPHRSSTVTSAAWLDLQSGDSVLWWTTGLEGDAFRADWHARLLALAETHKTQVDPLASMSGHLVQKDGALAEVVIASTWLDAIPEGLQVEWQELDPLHFRPLSGGVWTRRAVVQGVQIVPTPLSKGDRVAMRYVLPVADLDGELVLGFEATP